MAGIFISYRREDTAEMCDRLDASLAGYFGRDLIFKDKAAMVSGRDFADQIQQAIAQSNIMLVLIGPRWMSLTGASGVKRILEPLDYVRKEIELGRQHGVNIIPVLVNLAPMPGQAELPPSISFLSTLDAPALRVDPDYPWDTQRLIEKMLVLTPQLTPRFDAATALAQAKRGNAPTGWRVWRPSAGSAMRRAFAWFFVSALATFVLGGFATVLGVMGAGSSEQAASNAAITSLTIAGVTALVVGVIAGVIGLITGAANTRNGYLVLTPDGVTQEIGASHDSADFAEVENISTSVEVTTSGGGPNAPAMTTTKTRLTFLMRDGSQRLWGVRSEFGNVNAIGQAIVAAHNRYTQAHKGLGVPGLPQYIPPAPTGGVALPAGPATPIPSMAPITPVAYTPGGLAPAKSAAQRRPMGWLFLVIVGVLAGGLAWVTAFSNFGQFGGGVLVLAIVALAGFLTTWRARRFIPGLIAGAISGVVFAAIGDFYYTQALTYGAPPTDILLQDAAAIVGGCALAAVGGGLALLISRLARRG